MSTPIHTTDGNVSPACSANPAVLNNTLPDKSVGLDFLDNSGRYDAFSRELSSWNGKSALQACSGLLEAFPTIEDKEYLLSGLLYVAIDGQYDLPIIELLLNQGASPNRAAVFDKPAMLFALEKKCSPEIIGALLKKYTDVDEQYSGYTPLHWAVHYKCDLAVFKILLNKEANPDGLDEGHKSVMLLALKQRCSPEIISALLRGFTGTYDETVRHELLCSAVLYKNTLESFEALLERKVEGNQIDSTDRSILLFALEENCRSGIISVLLKDLKDIIFDASFKQEPPSNDEKTDDQALIQKLVRKLTNVNKVQKANWSESLVYWAIRSGCKWSLIQDLLNNIPDQKNYLWEPLVGLAIRSQCSPDIIEDLLAQETPYTKLSEQLSKLKEKSDSTNPKISLEKLSGIERVREEYRLSGLLYAAIDGQYDLSMITFLLSQGANPNGLDGRREPAVLRAIKQRCSPDVIRALLRGFTGLYDETVSHTLLCSAVLYKSNLESFEALLERKVEGNQIDSTDRSILLLALEKKCSSEIILVLLKDLKDIIFDASFKQEPPSNDEKKNDQEIIRELVLELTNLSKDQKANWSESLVYWAIRSDCEWPLIQGLLNNMPDKNYLWKRLAYLAIRSECSSETVEGLLAEEIPEEIQKNYLLKQVVNLAIRSQYTSETVEGSLLKEMLEERLIDEHAAFIDESDALKLYRGMLSKALRNQYDDKIILTLLEKIKDIEVNAKSKTENIAIKSKSTEEKEARQEDAINHSFVALAIQNGYSLTTIEPLLDRVKNRNQQGGEGGLLHGAALHPDPVKILNFLLEKGVDPKLKDEFQSPLLQKSQSPLLWAIEQNATQASIQVLLEAEKISAEEKEPWMSGLLKYAIERKSNFLTIQTLLQNGANPNLIVDSGDSILFFAIQKKSSAEIIEALLGKSKEIIEASLNNANSTLRSINQTLVRNGANPKLALNSSRPIQFASDASPDLKVIERKNLRPTTLVDWAIECKADLSIFETLVNNRTHPYLIHAFDRSAVSLAIKAKCDRKILALLLKNLKDIDQDKDEKKEWIGKLLEMAIESGSESPIIKCLLKQQEWSYSLIKPALFPAIQEHKTDIIQLLLKALKAVGEIDQNQQKEILTCANNFRYSSEIIDSILTPKSTDNSIQTLLSFALKENFNVNIVSGLLEKFTHFPLSFQNLSSFKRILKSENQDYHLKIALHSLREKMESEGWASLTWFRKICIQFFLWI